MWLVLWVEWFFWRGDVLTVVADAWTELGIYGGNEWGIGASMVSVCSMLSLS